MQCLEIYELPTSQLYSLNSFSIQPLSQGSAPSVGALLYINLKPLDIFLVSNLDSSAVLLRVRILRT